MRGTVAGFSLTALVVSLVFADAVRAQDDFESLVEEALEREAPPVEGLQAGESSAVPPRLRIRPAAPAEGGQEILIQPAPDAAVPAAPRRVVIPAPETPPPDPGFEAPAMQAAPAAPAAPEPQASPPAGQAAPAGPKPYTPPRRQAPPPETAEEAPAGPVPSEPEVGAGAGEGTPAEAATTGPAVDGGAFPDSTGLRSLVSLTPEEVNRATFTAGAETEATRGPSPIVLKAQILLDRAGASPGVIDGIFGGNVAKAIASVEAVLELPVDGRLDPQVWAALGGDQAADVLVEYVITEEDANYPFLPAIPGDYAEQAALPGLYYTSPEERFGERFHMDVRLLAALNREADFRRPGATIIVAAVEGQPVMGKISRIEADKSARQVRAYDAQDRLVVAYPATIGSSDNPSPSGEHIVNTIAPNPVYYYNPDNFVQGDNTEPLELPPGPNNPVGTMWIDLSEPTYGIHGTPEPSKIDKTGSHGCIRLTNWDAEELATLVERGVAVSFVE